VTTVQFAFKLRGKPVSIHEQFPVEIENRRKQLYPVMKQAKRDGKMATMTRDKLSVTICVVQTSRTCMFSSAFLCRRVLRACPCTLRFEWSFLTVLIVVWWIASP
jgi:hypothetical protein